MVFIVVYLILHFARSSAYHLTHTVDTCGYFFFQCNIVKKSPREGLKMGGYTLDLYKLTAIKRV